MISTEASPASGGESPPNSVTGIKRKHINYDDVDEGNAYQNDDDDPMKKGKTKASSSSEKVSTITDEGSPVKKARKGKKKKGGDDDGEKRLRRFRKHAPTSYLEIKERALSQRLTVINRERCGTDELPEEKVTIAGSTGNLYTVNIGLVPKCDCPHAKKGNQCKHIIYIMLRVLKAPENVGYQLALTSSELRSLIQNASPIPSANAEADSSDGTRKPIEGECPICYSEFEDGEDVVYCKAACGNNIHKECMVSWMTARHEKATCPLCRATWIDHDIPSGTKVNMDDAVWKEGYKNVASQLGLSGKRDYSTYHSYWVLSNFGGEYPS